MNQDVEVNDQKIDFVSAISARELGFTKKNCFSSTLISSTAEDELVKKQFIEKHCELPGVPRSTFLMEFSPDGTKVASTHGNHQIYVTDVRTGKHIKTLIGHPRTPWCIAFHPTSNQIIASGCLGGQVRIWDLSGGSEVWTSENPSVIASIAFHPDDRLLVIATLNELFFWDWSKPEPFMRVTTASLKEKVRYVAFDKLGHKLITGITNSPQTRWERVGHVPVSVSVPVPSETRTQTSWSAGPRRVTRRIVVPRLGWPAPNNNNNTVINNNAEPTSSTASNINSELLSSVPARERRITSCYRELVHQYEVLVHRYLQIYRRPIMIDQGTDPMEIESNNQSSQSNLTSTRPDSPIPSTSGVQRSSAEHPLKNRNRRLLFHTDSGGSSSSGSSPEDKGKTSGGTQTGDEHRSESKPATSNPKRPLSTDKNQSGWNSSTSSDDDDNDQDNSNKVKISCLNTNDTTHKNTDAASSSSKSNVRQFTPARQLRLKKVQPQKSNTSQEENKVAELIPEEEPKYKMRIKCFVTPNRDRERGDASTSGAGAGVSSDTAPSTIALSQAGQSNPSTSSTNTSTASRKDDINHLINNAKLMLAKYRETLQQRGLHDLPELSTSSSSMAHAGPSNKPSKGTNTNEIESPPKRKRRLLRPNLLGNILFTSSEDSSSDEVPEPQVVPTPTTIGPSEHSYAELDNQNNRQPGQGNSIELKRNRKRRFGDLDSVSSVDCNPGLGATGLSTGSDVNNLPKRSLLSSTSATATCCTTSESTTTTTTAPCTNLEQTTLPNDTNSSIVSLMDPHIQRLVVESLSVLDAAPSISETTSSLTNTSTTANVTRPSGGCNEHRLCGSCGGRMEDSPDTERNAEGCARTAMFCTRGNSPRNNSSTISTTNTATVPSTTPPLDRARRRFFSHRLSAFHPTLLSRMLRDRAGSSSRGRESPIPLNFAEDEVVNYSERDGEEAPTSSTSTTRNYHSLDPSPELMSLNPESIGFGSMYSNIVQELESSLNDVRNIRFRLGEMSDVLSNFSDRLENIMTQSNTILRNLSSSLEDLHATDEPAQPTLPQPNENQRPPTNSEAAPYSLSLEDLMQSWIRTYRNPYAPNANNPVNSDHTYPINPEATQNSTLSPLHLSLQLTVIHIQRQARLLRQQVESIERIDRAMIEVAQLQMMRQMFDELHVHFGANSSTDNNRSGVSSVRQMMAGTRISDSSPYDSPSDEGTSTGNTNSGTSAANNNNSGTSAANTGEMVESQPSTSGTTAVAPSTSGPAGNSSTEQNMQTQTSQSVRARCRKNYPRCLFLMHRQYRRTGNSALSARRNAAKDRVLLRRNIYRRFLPSRTTHRSTIDISSLRGRISLNLFNPDTLPSMTRRIEHYLMEHCRYIGRSVIPPTSGSSTRSDMGEHVMTLRLNNCRRRMNHLMGNFQLENNNTSVTTDGTSRFAARQALSYTLDTLTRFVEVNPNISIASSTFRSQIWEVIELSLLLSELLLLQIVDSIPPPSGMNLDRERENLSLRIDRMCTRMIQSRFVGASSQLTRSLRLMRMTVRHATRALRRTYTQRRNAMLPTNNDNDRGDSRQGLLDDIHNCLRNIRRYRELTSDRSDDDSNFGDWYRTINDLISRYTSTSSNDIPGPSTSSHRREQPDGLVGASNSTVLNSETGEEIRPSAVTVEDANSSDDNSNSPNVMMTMRPTSIGLYPTGRLNRTQDEDNDEERTWRSPNFLTVPTVQVNDVPIPDTPHPWRVRNSRLRLSERLDELRTVGLLRPRFLHPLYSGVVNPFAFEDNLDEAHREPIYDSDVIPTVTPNHRIQVWEFSQEKIPNISNSQKNLVVNECKIHNDASVDYASDGSILVTLLPSGGYMNVTNRLGVYSLEWQTLGQCLYVTSFEQNAVSVSLSPTNRHLLVGLASRRVSILPTETWTMARIFLLDYRNTTHGNLASIRELEQNRDSNFMSLNCIRWLPTAGQGLIFGTNTGHLRLLT